MKIHISRIKSLVAITALMGSMGAVAGDLSGGEWRYVGGEPGWVYEPKFSDGRTRSEVLKELAEFQKNPVVGDWRFVGGERGWMFEPTMRAGKSRAEVVRELEAFNRSPTARAQAEELYGNP